MKKLTTEQKEKIKNKINDKFIYNDKIKEIANNVIERLESGTQEDLWQCFDDELIYTEDQWQIIMNYITPKDIKKYSYFDIENIFFVDILKCIEEAKKQ